MKNSISILLIAAVCCFSSCKKDHGACKDEVTGIVKDYTGKLDGCAMMIELSNGGRLEVRTVPSGVTLVDGKKVAIKYTVNTQVASICMAGDIADITHLRYL